ncbi:PREDICTED: uncharacterized protein LOC104804066 [Tarenaya hassleriana]|uniref:uncharacterized protein LOC104804066 n=1 Tax=Tarenaya hassleriana TaxID=28532 RepID=UPI00053C6980|nr:PREDICTED: uncharacterized protein LOC104804066 [Tarenaya hassleriana]
MSYLNKVWMAATVAVMQSHGDHGGKWKAGLSSANRLQRRLSSDLQPLPVDDLTGEDPRRQFSSSPDESFRHVMYLNCWGQG